MIAAGRGRPDAHGGPVAAVRSPRWHDAAHPSAAGPRLRTAELLSIGTELTVGETRDTNAGELARALTARGVGSLRMTALPDRSTT